MFQVTKYLLLIMISKCIFNSNLYCVCYGKNYEHDDKLVQHLNDLYKEEESNFIDPNDMFGEEKQLVTDNMEQLSKSGDGCALERNGLVKLQKSLEQCSKENLRKDAKIKEEQQLNFSLQKKIVDKNTINAEEFYSRILKKFWSLLEMKDLVNKKQDAVEVHQLLVSVSAADVKALTDYFDKNTGYQQIDDFFQNGFEIFHQSDEHVFTQIQEYLSFLDMFRSGKTWMSLLWGTFIFLAIWAFLLFVYDIQQELRWGRLIIMMGIILFGISCLVHWNHLIQLQESKRHSYLMQKNLKDMPDECRKEISVWSRILGTVFGSGENPCDEYYRNVMIEAGDEISPAIVISETVSKFALHPLKYLGANIGRFFSEFYGNVPVYMQIPVSLMFLFMFIISVLSLFGYGIYLPFWLGSIRPAAKPSIEEVRRLIQQSEDKINSDNRKLINEARDMLMDISKATLSVMNRSDQVPVLQTDFQSVLQDSTQLIGKRLEHLILSELSSIRQKVLPLDKCEAAQRKSELCQNSSEQLDRPSCSKQQTDGKDNVDGNICETSSNVNFLRRVKEVLGQPLNQSVSVSPLSEDDLISNDSFLKKVESVMSR